MELNEVVEVGVEQTEKREDTEITDKDTAKAIVEESDQ